MNFSKRKILFLFLTVFLSLISLTSLMLFFTDLVLYVLTTIGLIMSCKQKQKLEICMYISLGVVSILPKLEGAIFESGFLPSFVFVISYITLCTSGLLFVVKLYRRIKYVFKKREDSYKITY